MLKIKIMAILFLAINGMGPETAFAQEEEPGHLEIAKNTKLTLNDVIEHVIKQSPNLGVAVAKDELSKAYETKASNFFAASPQMSLTYENDQLASDIGQKEWEGILRAPIWVPGEKASHKKAARYSKEQAALYRAKLKWETAGEVRDLLWNIQITENDLKQSKKAVALFKELKAKIETAVKLGNQPANDLALATQEVISKQMDEKEAERAYVDSSLDYKIFTGLSERPVNIAEPLAVVDHDPDTPNILFLQSTVSFYQAQYQAALKKWPTAPSVSVGVKRMRSNLMGLSSNTVNVNLTIPIGGKSYKAKNLAEARQTLAIAERNYQLSLRTKDLENHEVEHELEVCEFQLEASEVYYNQAIITKESAQKAYDLGEYSLLNYLRIQEKYLQSSRKLQQQKLLCGQIIAKHNQVKGVLPK